ncbi:MAG TPA: DISARM system helicase DrmA [Streptosporangiaceae bacterium]|nr:DISARM system helicase DrmA [Streptosporangiaceae bacterium]
MSEDGGTQAVLEVPTAAGIRDELHRLVIADLHGPLGGESEEFSNERPTDRYIVGRLAPDGTVIEPDTQDDTADAGRPDAGEDQPEPSAPNIVSLAPSALGCTVYVEGTTTVLQVRAEWAWYRRTIPETDSGQSRIWQRVPVRGEARVTLAEGELGPLELNAEYRQVLLRGRARRHDGNWLVSLFLVNAQPRPGALPDSAWLFQVRLVVDEPGRAAVFLPRPDSTSGGDQADKAEQRRLAMAYRACPEFAVGHGTGVHVTAADGDPMRAVEVATSAVPDYEIPFTGVPEPGSDPDLPWLDELVLDMRALADLELPELVNALAPLAAGYREWIDRQEERVTDPASHLEGYRHDAAAALAAARRAADRIEAGIGVLQDNPAALAAFRFANRAMYLQRVHTLAAEKRNRDRTLTIDDALDQVRTPRNHSWRPFQLAFILLNLPSLADPTHPERTDGDTAVADLLWFPTGGGKTEAYLGLTAFVLAVRRLQEGLGGFDTRAGVAVVMRYTLRLLTIQQFQRAAALVCACETIRLEDTAVWGNIPFRIGLWVGARVTPNRTDDADDWLKQQRGGRRAPTRAMGSPHQLVSCPWCGTALEPGRDIAVDTVTRRTLITCPDVFCAFGPGAGNGEGLPVVVVDEEIYRLLPSLIIGTVDKFAQLTWRGETQGLFGRVSKRCTRHGYITADTMTEKWELSTDTSQHPAKGAEPAARIEKVAPLRPPDLIVQDELHLISGPLGSMVGLYESVVDRLATWELAHGKRARPKVVASTATARRAYRQIGALFDRQTEVFPPPGLDISDSFFARQRPTSADADLYAPGRRYVGICAHGIRMKSTLIRVYVSVLGAAQKLHEKYGRNEVTDPYMTLVGYFNSLRDLGGMRRLVEDDVSSRLTRADERGLARRYDPLLRELTSRLSSTDIPEVLGHLMVPFVKDRPKGERPPIDVLLATSMIAVGVDVPRLGIMVVANQPKSSAEYVQATSRVGRQAPGLVFTVFNWARPRDLSHFESFEHFHATIYRQVEALSVTPFADRAVDRGLTGVLVALVRDLGDAYNANLRASAFDRNDELADHIVRYLKRRAGNVSGDNSVSNAVERQLDSRLDLWNKERRVPGRRLTYDRPFGASDDVVGLLHRPEEGSWRKMTCQTSLRNVDQGIRLLLSREEPGVSIVDEPPFEPAAGAAAAGDGAAS